MVSEFALVLSSLSVTAIVSGAALAYVSTRRPAHTATLERWGGILMVTGLALIGVGLGAGHPR